jgi:hypothetical protein
MKKIGSGWMRVKDFGGWIGGRLELNGMVKLNDWIKSI